MSVQDAPTRHRALGTRRVDRSNQRGRHASSRGEDFGRFAGITVMSLVPGAGLIAVGRRMLGTALLVAATAAVALIAIMVVTGGLIDRIVDLTINPRQLLVLTAVATLVGCVWCATIVVSAWHSRPERPTRAQGFLGVVLVSAICLAVATPSAIGAKYALIQRGALMSIFGDDPGGGLAGRGSDPWAQTPRVNLLLLGSDAGADRIGVRTDSMIVASINTKTGDAVLIGLPRNLQKVPFPESNPLRQVWPDGFNCGDECLLNGVWDQAATVRKDLFPNDPQPGLTTIRGVISEITGLRIDAHAVIDLQGFSGLVNAMGGVKVNVPRRIPVGPKGAPTSFIEPGQQRLDGYQALWFSRSRDGSDDYDRMKRQRCMVGNLVSQVNPMSLLAKYPQLVSVLQKNIQTDVKQNQLKAWVILVQRMQKGNITSLPFTDAVVNSVRPDFIKIREYISVALEPQTPNSATQSTTPPTTQKSETRQPGTAPPSTGGTADNAPKQDATTAQDNKDVC